MFYGAQQTGADWFICYPRGKEQVPKGKIFYVIVYFCKDFAQYIKYKLYMA